MGNDRRKEIKRHRSPAELDKLLNEETDPKIVQRLCFVKNLYHGDTLAEAAARVGKSQPTGVRWAERWNEDGVAGLIPEYGDGRPPKLDEEDREQLAERLREDPPWTAPEVRDLIREEFGVSYHPNYIHELLNALDLKELIVRQRRTDQPQDR